MLVTLRLILVGAVLACACSKSRDSNGQSAPATKATTPAVTTDDMNDAAPASQKGHWYRAEVELEGENGIGPVPFFMRIPPTATTLTTAMVRAGQVDLPMEASWNAGRLSIDLPLLRASLRAEKAEQKRLRGTWSSDSWIGGKAALVFRAKPINEPDPALLFPENPEHMKLAKQNLTSIGVWRVTMADASMAKLTIEKASERGLFGSFQTAGGNNVPLGGMLMGNQLYLASFDGSYAFSLRAEVDRTKMHGTWTPLRETKYPETFTAERTNEFSLQQSIKMLARDLDIPGIDLSVYADRPLLVELIGSWCANCRSAQPFLVEMYEKYHPMGLEMLTLTYEFSDDEAFNRKQAKTLADKFGVTWRVKAVTGGLEAATDIMPQTVEGIDLSGLPVTVFIRRDGFVHQIASGFPGKGMAGYEEHIQLYENWIKEILDAGR